MPLLTAMDLAVNDLDITAGLCKRFVLLKWFLLSSINVCCPLSSILCCSVSVHTAPHAAPHRTTPHSSCGSGGVGACCPPRSVFVARLPPVFSVGRALFSVRSGLHFQLSKRYRTGAILAWLCSGLLGLRWSTALGRCRLSSASHWTCLWA